MVERSNGRISEVPVPHRLESSLALEQTLKRYGHLYNYHTPQKALGRKTQTHALNT